MALIPNSSSAIVSVTIVAPGCIINSKLSSGEIIEEKTHYDERNKTLEYMDLYNWEKVRGYAWCCEKLHKKPILKNNKRRNN